MLERKGTLFLKHTQIVIHWTDGRQETIRLGEVTRIGRGKHGNDIPVPEVYQSVSRRHLEIRRESDGYRLLDLGSRNGVLINGIYVKDTYLRDGDEIRIGQDDQGNDIRIEFQLGSEAFLSELSLDDKATIVPVAGLAGESPLNTPHFKIRWHNGRTNYFPILKDRIVIGRGPEADLRIPDTLRFVSGQHVEILKRESAFLIRDLNSTNGTLLNNQPLKPGQFYPLVHEAIFRFGDDEYGISVGLTFVNPASQATAMDGFVQTAAATEVAKIQHILIGRLPSCNLVLDHPEVSRRHALIRQIENKTFIEDLNSSNGTLVNDQPIKHAELHEGDLIQISTYLLLFEGGQLVPYQNSGMRLDVCNLSLDVQTGSGRRRILDNVNFTVLPREFVALIGSELDTTALLETLVGVKRGEGQIKLNGHDFYRQVKSIRSQLGYVPSFDILPGELTVEAALDYAARLRLHAGLSPAERRLRIGTVLDTVSLNTATLRRTRISGLSDEQRKRLNIAVELLDDPKIVYLDQATRGLDPGLEKKMMYTLRRVADEGRTVILVTPATSNIIQTDQIAFLAEGNLVYFGPPEEALRFFKVEDFADIYECIDTKGQDWRRIFEQQKPEYYKKYVVDRQKSLASAPRHKLPQNEFSILDTLRQFPALLQRTADTLLRQPIGLLFRILLLTILAILQLMIAHKDILAGNVEVIANPTNAASTLTASYAPFLQINLFLFLMGFGAMLTGLVLPLNEFIQERSIFLRERMLNLKVLPYLLSKTFVYGALVFIAVLLYLAILSLGVRFPKSGLYLPGFVEIFISLFLTALAGMGLGLLISAVSTSRQRALTLLLAILFFQFFFAGALLDLRGSKLESLSYLSPTRWSLTALGVTVDMNKLVGSTILCKTQSADPGSAPKTVCVPYPQARADLRLNYAADQLTTSWAVLIGMTILFLASTWFILPRHDTKQFQIVR